MDDQAEQELLLHVAAGTDLLTALAALPPDEEEPKQPRKPTGCLGAVFVILCLLWATIVLL